MVDLKSLSDLADRGPWQYRPDPYDDWGMIRGREIRDAELGPVRPPVARSNATWSELDNFDLYRANNTDPMEPNGRFIVELVNAYREGRLVEVDKETE